MTVGAFFSTASGGYAPEGFLRDTDEHDAAIESILATPTSTSAHFAPEVGPGCKNTWRMMAERGFFAFDADFNGGPYHLVAAPVTPICVADLPPLVADVVRQIAFSDLRFANLQIVPADLLRRGAAES